MPFHWEQVWVHIVTCDLQQCNERLVSLDVVTWSYLDKKGWWTPAVIEPINDWNYYLTICPACRCYLRRMVRRLTNPLRHTSDVSLLAHSTLERISTQAELLEALDLTGLRRF